MRAGIAKNKWSLAAFAIGVLLLAAVLFVPVFGRLIMVEALKGIQIMWIILLAFIPTFIIQTVRMVKECVMQRKGEKNG